MNTVPSKVLNDILKNKPERHKLLAENSFYYILLNLGVYFRDLTNTYFEWAHFDITMDEKSKILLVSPNEEIDIQAEVTKNKIKSINISPTCKLNLLTTDVGMDIGYKLESGCTFKVPVNLAKYRGGYTSERTAFFQLYGPTIAQKYVTNHGEAVTTKAAMVIQIPKEEKPMIDHVDVEGRITKTDAILWTIDLKGSIELIKPDSLIPT